jgi:hypothetical protein
MQLLLPSFGKIPETCFVLKNPSHVILKLMLLMLGKNDRRSFIGSIVILQEAEAGAKTSLRPPTFLILDIHWKKSGDEE